MVASARFGAGCHSNAHCARLLQAHLGSHGGAQGGQVTGDHVFSDRHPYIPLAKFGGEEVFIIFTGSLRLFHVAERHEGLRLKRADVGWRKAAAAGALALSC